MQDTTSTDIRHGSSLGTRIPTDPHLKTRQVQRANNARTMVTWGRTLGLRQILKSLEVNNLVTFGISLRRPLDNMIGIGKAGRALSHKHSFKVIGTVLNFDTSLFKFVGVLKRTLGTGVALRSSAVRKTLSIPFTNLVNRMWGFPVTASVVSGILLTTSFTAALGTFGFFTLGTNLGLSLGLRMGN